MEHLSGKVAIIVAICLDQLLKVVDDKFEMRYTARGFG
jgi:hypothetical protein